MFSKNRLRATLVTVLLLGSGTALAQSDPPGRVGRLSYEEGPVSFHTADQTQWSPAAINYPVVAGSSFWTEPGSRAEIEVGGAEFRLGETTALDFTALDDRNTRLTLEQGAINVHLRALPPGGVVVETPRGEVDLVAPGSYHIDASHPNGDQPPDHVQVTVLEGQAEASGPRSRVEIMAGESAVIGGDPVSFTLVEGNSTPLDDWALQRERREEAREAARYVSPEATGYQDLDDYGRWSSDPTYGAVWYPTAVAPGWAPYRYGHWAWVPPWGWTWVDDAPWGFAPFHYGRWVQVGGAWGWVPGVIVPHPVYAPALVAFIGGAGFGITLTAGPALPAVGWVPLAPFEVYHPCYHTSVAYVRNVNITSVRRTVINNITVVNNTTVVNNYANRQAATVVPAVAFTRAAPVQRAVVAVPREELAHARVAVNLAHLQPSAAARAAIAQPAAAERVVPRPNAPARLAAAPAAVPVPPHGQSEPALPRAPGPAFHPAPQAAHRYEPPRYGEPPRPAAAPAITRPSVAVVKPPQPPRPPESWAAPRAPTVAAAAPPRPPLAHVPHPVQRTSLQPTPHGWQRAPVAQHAASRPAPHRPPPAREQRNEEHRPAQ